MEMDRYDELCATEAETRLANIDAAKAQMQRMFRMIYSTLNIDVDGNYTLQGTWDAIEEAIDDYTHLDRAIAEKTIADYERKSTRRHQEEERTTWTKDFCNAH